MTGTPRLPDFNARSAPTAVKLARLFIGLLWLLVVAPFSLSVIGAAADILVAIAASRPIRDGRGFWPELVIVALFLGGIFLIELPLVRLLQSQWFMTLHTGKPRFWPLKGGPGKQLFEFLLRCSGSVDLQFEAEIEALIRRIAARDVKPVKQMYRHLYEQAGLEQTKWHGTWKQIQRTECAGMQYGEAIRNGRWNMFWLKYVSILKLVLPLSFIYTTGTFWFLADVANGKNPLRLVQFALVAGIVISLIIFISYTVLLQTFRFSGQEEYQEMLKGLGVDEAHLSLDAETLATIRQIDEPMPDPELQREVDSLAGKDFYPIIVIKPGYIEAIRNEFARDFLVFGSLRVAVFVSVLLAQWPIALALSHWPGAQLDTWTVKMLVGTAVIPIALVAALGLGFIILSRFRRFAGVLATGLLLAAVPPLIAYMLRGSVGTVVFVSSIVTAAIGALPAAIAELIKQKPSFGSTP
jgi:hypothetical protein